MGFSVKKFFYIAKKSNLITLKAVYKKRNFRIEKKFSCFKKKLTILL